MVARSSVARARLPLYVAERFLATLRLANGMANPSVYLSSVVSVVYDVRASYSGGNFSGYFCTILYLAIRQLTHQKITKIVQGDHPLREG